MEEKSQEEKDKSIKETIDFAADQFARLIWKHWLWLQKEKERKSQYADS